MLRMVRAWYQRYFSNDESIIIILLIAGFSAILATLGGILAPVLAAIVLAYLLQGIINQLAAWRVPKTLALAGVYALFLGSLASFLFVLVPLTWGQLVRLVSVQLPLLVTEGARVLRMLPLEYPEIVSEQWISDVSTVLTTRMNTLVDSVVSFSVSSLPSVMDTMIFIVLLPLLVFFFLKDKDRLIAWFVGFLPQERPFMNRVMSEMNIQIANYVRGKAIEILITGSITYVAFLLLGLQYAALLAFMVGLSVVIPYIGVVLVTVPVVVVAYFQFGWGADFFAVMVVHLIIQTLDGNLLVPLLFSEAVNLHPIAIMVAVLVFGGVWGIWGLFFAIPLATLVNAIFSSWPREEPPSNRVDWMD
ncbi:Putative permease [gamma proteobacterium HdN1]|nr:Putative permease [gamma proteobacterium HdN1]